jgi:hypothetical protein
VRKHATAHAEEGEAGSAAPASTLVGAQTVFPCMINQKRDIYNSSNLGMAEGGALTLAANAAVLFLWRLCRSPRLVQRVVSAVSGM